jgi:hypothetical protein
VEESTTTARELVREGAAARLGGDLDRARAAFAAAFDRARGANDVATMTDAALGLASGQMWGTFPGRTPAFLHEAYRLAEGPGRARLAAALARSWVYAGEPQHATPFAAEAVALAGDLDDPVVLAEALDADLLVHWGPDDLEARLRATARLEELAVHLTDVDARLGAHLWRLTTALESLDVVGVQRQLRALDVLADESGSARIRFFAASRRGMHALLAGDLPAAAARLDQVRRWGTEAGEPDLFALEHTLAAGIARQLGEPEALAREAEVFQDFGTREGAPSVTAQAAVLWLEAGDPDRAADLLGQVAGTDFGRLPRDVEWLVTITSLVDVAVAVGDEARTAIGIDLLEPCAGRAVVNAGAVAFEGVVDDYLARAGAMLGRPVAARWATQAIDAYRRIAAPWWGERLTSHLDVALTASVQPRSAHTQSAPAGSGGPPASPPVGFELRRLEDGIWMLGAEGRAAPVRESRGFLYLRTLLGHPGVPFVALELASAAAGHPAAVIDEADHGEVADRRAVAAYRRRLAQLDGELDEARGWSDGARAEALELERDALLAEVASATGLAGRPRRSGASAERARVAVRKAISTAIARIEEVDPTAARILRDTVRTGTTCTYEPDPDRPIRWVLD